MAVGPARCRGCGPRRCRPTPSRRGRTGCRWPSPSRRRATLSLSPNLTDVQRLVGLHPQDGEIDLGVLADDLGLELAAVGEDHGDVVGVADHMVVGDDDAGGNRSRSPSRANWSAAAGAGRPLSPPPPFWPLLVEEIVEEVLERRSRRKLRRRKRTLFGDCRRAEMLTTASMTFSARSAKDSAPTARRQEQASRDRGGYRGLRRRRERRAPEGAAGWAGPWRSSFSGSW